ncbi:uncharacterized protein LOC116619255 [Nematostella vectensis]|uniref:uncharacterized protein LOC116619255 n=1 Tax=Nematostella vectensis TaxID=45351 RepID=UPI00138FC4F4|nr:uncharacterized protein LOC116619255 [Nematostella vectensis]
MAAIAKQNIGIESDLFSSLSSEVLSIILSYLPAKTLLNLSETCRRFKELCFECDTLWKDLCKTDYKVSLLAKGNFRSYHMIYQLIYKCRIILIDTDYSTYSGCLPDWLYYWSALGSKPPLIGFWSLPAGRTKKTWGLTDEDLANWLSDKKNLKPDEVRLERYYTWYDGMQASIYKHGSLKKFQEVALKRCIRSRKQILTNFPQSARSQRKRNFQRFQNEHNHLKEFLAKQKGNAEHLCYSKPKKIGRDYIEGLLHKSGKKQLYSFVEFIQECKDRCSASTPYLLKDVPKCVSRVYKMCSDVYERHVQASELLALSDKYMARAQEVWDWQSANGLDYMKKYRSCKVVKAHLAFKEYVCHGNEHDFECLRLHFEGLESLSIWLESNQWVTKLIDSSLVQILQDVSTEKPCKDPDGQTIKRLVRRYLKTGRKEDFDKVLKKLCEKANEFLTVHRAHVDELERTLGSNSSPINTTS